MLVDAVGRMAARGRVEGRRVRIGGVSVGCSHTTGAGGHHQGVTPRASNAWVLPTDDPRSPPCPTQPTPHPDPASAGLRLRQDRARRPRPRPARRRRRARLDRRRPPRSSPTLGLPVTKVEDLTGFPECLDGRVKTLHPRVHAGILADRRLESHVAAARRARRRAVRPGRRPTSTRSPQTVASGAAPDECVEQIDIGGPSMVRAAAKNHPSASRSSPRPRRTTTCWPPSAPAASPSPQRQRLAAEAFVHTATYDVARGVVDGQRARPTPAEGSGFPAWMGATWTKAAVLRYGENPHQRAALYSTASAGGPGLAAGDAAARQGDVLQQLRRRRRGPPGGVRLRRAGGGDHQARQPVRHRGRRRRRRRRTARRTRATRSRPSAASSPPTCRSRVEMAEQVAEIFTEVIVAPGYEDGRGRGPRRRKKNIRILECPPLARGGGEMRADLRRAAAAGAAT